MCRAMGMIGKMSTEQQSLFSMDPTRAEQILKAFIEFHAENPKVWELFKRYARQAINAGRKHHSSKAVFERLRWYFDFETSGQVKLNNNFTAYYARLFHAKFPEHDGFFQNRKRISEDADPARDPEAIHIQPNAVGEDELIRRLSAL
jgi:hypothetical protein